MNTKSCNDCMPRTFFAKQHIHSLTHSHTCTHTNTNKQTHTHTHKHKNTHTNTKTHTQHVSIKELELRLKMEGPPSLKGNFVHFLKTASTYTVTPWLKAVYYTSIFIHFDLHEARAVTMHLSSPDYTS